jgi:tRNA (guanine-N7-)-methyltransferase
MDIIKETGTMVVNNPESNMGNAVGCAPVLQMMQKGITVGMGTDAYTHDMLESMKVFLIIQRHNAALPNVAFLRTRVEFLPALFAPGEVSEIWLTFSDPQMKSPNSRLTSPVFLERYRTFLRPGGILHLKTDSRFLHEYSKAVAVQNGLTVLACTDDLYGEGRQAVLDSPLASITGRSAVEALFEVRTFYEKMFMAQGYKITYLCFTLDKEAPIQAPEFDEKYWRSVEGPRVFRPILTD